MNERKSIFLNRRLLLIIVAGAAIFILYAHLETYWMQTIDTMIEDASLPPEFSGKRIVYISDIHCGEYFGIKQLAGVVDQINSLNPDIVLFGGDYVNRNGKDTIVCFKELAKVNAPLGKFGVLGNHDPEVGREKIKTAMTAAGIIPLVNESRNVNIGESNITIAGVDETWYGKPDGKRAMADSFGFAIYLSHDPRYLEQYDDPKIKLMLAGHTHGGQVTLFGIPLASLAHHHRYKYEKGIFPEDGRTIIVTNGIGTTILPFRFFARPQINLITLQRNN